MISLASIGNNHQEPLNDPPQAPTIGCILVELEQNAFIAI